MLVFSLSSVQETPCACDFFGFQTGIQGGKTTRGTTFCTSDSRGLSSYIPPRNLT